MGSKLRRRRVAAVTGTMVLSVPIIAACTQGPTFDQWAETDGAAGRINLDEVQEAFKKSESATEFERKVNEIYEGDRIVLIRVRDDGAVKTIEAFEDLNNSGVIEDTTDDRMFSISEREKEIRGHGANGYYRSGFGGGGNFLFTFLILSSLTRGPGGYYNSGRPSSTIRSNRTRYRSSSGYRSQVSKNTKFFDTQKKGAGRFSKSSYDNASGNRSTSRQSYLNRQKTSGAFKRSTTGVRSSWGSKSTGRSFGRASSRGGGFRGFGGAQRIIGIERG